MGLVLNAPVVAQEAQHLLWGGGLSGTAGEPHEDLGVNLPRLHVDDAPLQAEDLLGARPIAIAREQRPGGQVPALDAPMALSLESLKKRLAQIQYATFAAQG